MGSVESGPNRFHPDFTSPAGTMYRSGSEVVLVANHPNFELRRPPYLQNSYTNHAYNEDDRDRDRVIETTLTVKPPSKCTVCSTLLRNSELPETSLPYLKTVCEECFAASGEQQSTDLEMDDPDFIQDFALSEPENQSDSDCDSLSDNFFVKKSKKEADETSLVSSHRSSVRKTDDNRPPQLTICNACEEGNQAIKLCNECGHICEECADAHQKFRQLQRHAVTVVNELQQNSQTGGKSHDAKHPCARHPEHEVVLYCTKAECQLPICAMCTLEDHDKLQGHVHVKLQDAMEGAIVQIKETSAVLADKKDKVLTLESTIVEAKKLLTEQYRNKGTELLKIARELHQWIDKRHLEASSKLDQLYKSQSEILEERASAVQSVSGQLGNVNDLVKGTSELKHPIEVLESRDKLTEGLRLLETVAMPEKSLTSFSFQFTEAHQSALDGLKQYSRHLFDFHEIPTPQGQSPARPSSMYSEHSGSQEIIDDDISVASDIIKSASLVNHNTFNGNIAALYELNEDSYLQKRKQDVKERLRESGQPSLVHHDLPKDSDLKGNTAVLRELNDDNQNEQQHTVSERSNESEQSPAHHGPPKDLSLNENVAVQREQSEDLHKGVAIHSKQSEDFHTDATVHREESEYCHTEEQTSPSESPRHHEQPQELKRTSSQCSVCSETDETGSTHSKAESELDQCDTPTDDSANAAAKEFSDDSSPKEQKQSSQRSHDHQEKPLILQDADDDSPDGTVVALYDKLHEEIQLEEQDQSLLNIQQREQPSQDSEPSETHVTKSESDHSDHSSDTSCSENVSASYELNEDFDEGERCQSPSEIQQKQSRDLHDSSKHSPLKETMTDSYQLNDDFVLQDSKERSSENLHQRPNPETLSRSSSRASEIGVRNITQAKWDDPTDSYFNEDATSFHDFSDDFHLEDHQPSSSEGHPLRRNSSRASDASVNDVNEYEWDHHEDHPLNGNIAAIYELNGDFYSKEQRESPPDSPRMQRRLSRSSSRNSSKSSEISVNSISQSEWDNYDPPVTGIAAMYELNDDPLLREQRRSQGLSRHSSRASDMNMNGITQLEWEHHPADPPYNGNTDPFRDLNDNFLLKNIQQSPPESRRQSQRLSRNSSRASDASFRDYNQSDWSRSRSSSRSSRSSFNGSTQSELSRSRSSSQNSAAGSSTQARWSPISSRSEKSVRSITTSSLSESPPRSSDIGSKRTKIAPRLCTATLDKNLRLNKACKTVVRTFDTFGDPIRTSNADFQVQLEYDDAGWQNADGKIVVFDHLDGSYTIQFTPCWYGNHRLSVAIDGIPIKDSPFMFWIPYCM